MRADVPMKLYRSGRGGNTYLWGDWSVLTSREPYGWMVSVGNGPLDPEQRKKSVPTQDDAIMAASLLFPGKSFEGMPRELVGSDIDIAYCREVSV